MSLINAYALFNDFKDWVTSAGVSPGEDVTNENVVNDILEAASRYFDKNTGGRTFYPRVETRNYDTPLRTRNDRELWLDDDLLEIITVTNGDDVAVTSSDYILDPADIYPKYAIRLKEASSVFWKLDSNGNKEQVIDIAAFWGVHDEYLQRAWTTGSTLDEGSGMNATVTNFTVDDGKVFAEGTIIKIDNELMIVDSALGEEITVIQRAENGSTAATHDDAAVVYIWNPQADIKLAILDMTNSYYKRRYGEGVIATSTITGAGVVIAPQDVSDSVKTIIENNSGIV
jgi:hypothetical protein